MFVYLSLSNYLSSTSFSLFSSTYLSLSPSLALLSFHSPLLLLPSYYFLLFYFFSVPFLPSTSPFSSFPPLLILPLSYLSLFPPFSILSLPLLSIPPLPLPPSFLFLHLLSRFIYYPVSSSLSSISPLHSPSYSSLTLYPPQSLPSLSPLPIPLSFPLPFPLRLIQSR